AQRGRRAVGRDAVQPGGELGLLPEPPQALVGPQVGVLYHVARVLLVAREAVRQRVGVGVRRPDQLIEGRPVTRLGGGDQIGQLECHTPLWTGTGRERLLPGANGFRGGACAGGPTGSTSSSRTARG